MHIKYLQCNIPYSVCFNLYLIVSFSTYVSFRKGRNDVSKGNTTWGNDFQQGEITCLNSFFWESECREHVYLNNTKLHGGQFHAS